jgi:hypothetical protein
VSPTEKAPGALRDTALWLVDALLASARAAGDEALAAVLADARDALDALDVSDLDPPMA